MKMHGHHGARVSGETVGKIRTHLALEGVEAHAHTQWTDSCKHNGEADGNDTWMNTHSYTQ